MKKKKKGSKAAGQYAPEEKVKFDCDPHRRLKVDKRATLLANIDSGDEDDLLTSDEVAAWLGVSRQFVELSRIKNYGPEYVRLSARCIRYRRGAVTAWLRARAHHGTAEYA